MAEKYVSFSPYNYVLNNPMNAIDPDGRSVFDIITKAVTWFAKVSNQANNTIQSATNLSTGQSGQINAPEGVVSEQTENMAKAVGTLQDVQTVAETAVDVIETATSPIASTVPGFDTAVEALSGQKGSVEGVAMAAAAVIPAGKIVSKTIPKVVSLVKQNPTLAKIAKNTFEGNSSLSSEVNRAIKQISNGNMSPGIGTKNIGNGVFESRTKSGGRIYFRNNNGSIEVLGYSNKSNQQQVIDIIKKEY